MTSTTLSYCLVIISIIAFILPIWDAINNTSKKGLKRITRIGWFCIATALIMAILSILNINATNKEKIISEKSADSIRNADKAQIISSVQKALKENNLSFNPNTNKVEQIVPLLYLTTDKEASYIKTESDNKTVSYRFYLENNTKADIYNFSIKLYAITIEHIGSNTKVSTDNKPLSYDLFVPKGKSTFLQGKVKIDKVAEIDSVYFYLKGSYSNYDKTIVRSIDYMVMQIEGGEILISDEDKKFYVLQLVEKVKPSFIK